MPGTVKAGKSTSRLLLFGVCIYCCIGCAGRRSTIHPNHRWERLSVHELLLVCCCMSYSWRFKFQLLTVAFLPPQPPWHFIMHALESGFHSGTSQPWQAVEGQPRSVARIRFRENASDRSPHARVGPWSPQCGTHNIII